MWEGDSWRERIGSGRCGRMEGDTGRESERKEEGIEIRRVTVRVAVH